ncbi:protein ULTRAPETALA 2-like [Cynara cardunculus var. scolymus]|uniref:protein ULTRAPETALA 2-like n=1 Tax=Cynara cardunculus var. scolymus TaxID=59895 RepID=UPI000D62C03B|nr:protein ULTRAPETALA 2-like [Cynara cardunculus var. scolymus]
MSQIRVMALHYIEIICGCTSTRFGDKLGLLRIADDGSILAICNCNENCNQVFTSPVEFAKHGSRASSVSNWRSKVWVRNCNGKKTKLSKTCLLRYYRGDEYRRPYNEVGHRDQFLNCSACNKLRRFELRTKEACRLYHDAVARPNRTCYDMIPGRSGGHVTISKKGKAQ